MRSLDFWKSCLLLSSFLSLNFSIAYCQEKISDKMGVLLAGQILEYEFNPIVGITYERGLSKWSSLELGLFYRINLKDLYLSIDGPNFSITEWSKLSEGFVSIPFLFRMSTRYANFFVGPQMEIFSTWQQLGKGQITVDAYNINPRVTIGPLLKLGREIKFKETLILEPEIRLGVRSFGFGEGFFGLGLRLKKEVLNRN